MADTTASAAASSSDEARLQCMVVTPERVILDEMVNFVALPIIDGELGVLPGHMPIVGRLGYGELRTKIGQTSSHWFIDGGFVQVRSNVVTVLTSRAIPRVELDFQAAERDLALALSRPASTATEREEKDRALARARGMIRLSAK